MMKVSGAMRAARIFPILAIAASSTKAQQPAGTIRALGAQL